LHSLQEIFFKIERFSLRENHTHKNNFRKRSALSEVVLSRCAAFLPQLQQQQQ
jgi:hypothetical protein